MTPSRRGLVAAATSLSPFEAEFDDFGWFGDRVVWLAPAHPEQFEYLIRQAMDAFPDCPPYGGAFDAVVPHVTIGEGGDMDRLRAAMDAIRPQLPLTSEVTSLSLMVGSREPGSWSIVERVALGT